MKNLTAIDDLFNINDGLSSAIISSKKYKQTQLHLDILEASAFLPEDAKYLERIHAHVFSLTFKPTCRVCNKFPAVFNSFSSKYGNYSPTCKSKSCVVKFSTPKRNQTLLDKYGALVGPGHISKNADAIKSFVEKSRVSIKEKYGVDNASQIPGNAKKKQRTLFDNYGVTHPSQINSVRIKTKNKSILSFQKLCDTVTVTDITAPKKVCKMINFLCKQCSIADALATETYKWRCRNIKSPCTKCTGIFRGSVLQNDILNHIVSITDCEVLSNNRSVLPSGQELDIFIPSKNIAIEVNGIFWHSSGNAIDDKKNKFYHLNKTLQCENIGIQLIHIFEDDWTNNKEFIKHKLQSTLNPIKINNEQDIKLCKLEKDEFSGFCETHMQEYNHSNNAYGLKLNGRILAAVSVNKAKQSITNFCSLIFIPEKMLSNLMLLCLTDCSISKLTYIEPRTWSSITYFSNVFSKSFGPPLDRWIKNDKSLSRNEANAFHKTQSNEKCLSTGDLMFAAGWRRIWDCGTTKWVLNINNDLPENP